MPPRSLRYMDDALAAGDTVEAGLVRALDLLDDALERTPAGDVRSLVQAARHEIDDAAALVPAIGRIALN